LIRILVTFISGRSLWIAKETGRATVHAVEDIMMRHPSRVKKVHVVARGSYAKEGVLIHEYLRTVDLEIRITKAMDRTGVEDLDVYEMCRYPRKRRKVQ
jgi:hypothetical protein